MSLIYLWLIIWIVVEKQALQAEKYLTEKEIHESGISQWTICQCLFTRLESVLSLSWSLFIDLYKLYYNKRYLSSRPGRRKNQNNELHLYILNTLIA